MEIFSFVSVKGLLKKKKIKKYVMFSVMRQMVH